MRRFILILLLLFGFNLHADNSKVNKIRLNAVINRLLKNDKKLESIKFKDLELSGSKLDEFIDALKQNSYLKELCFGKLKINDNDFGKLLTVFDKNITISKLCFNNMSFSLSKIEIVNNFLEKNSTIQHIVFNSDALDLKTISRIAKALNSNYTLRKIELKDNLNSKNAKHVKVFEKFAKSLENNYSLENLEIFDEKYNKKSKSSLVLNEGNFETIAYKAVKKILKRNKEINDNIDKYDLYKFRKPVYRSYAIISSGNNNITKVYFWDIVAYVLKFKIKQNDFEFESFNKSLNEQFNDLLKEECSICSEKLFEIDLKDLKKNDISVTKCGHIFHKNCLDLWLNEKRICPMCRADL
jgi:hypothetical protein